MYSVLYVDDEEILLGLNKIYLEKTREFIVDTTNSAQDALEKIPKTHYDAIVSDYDMPHMDGISLLKQVRSLYGDLPFLLFTGKGREEVVIEAVDNGVDFYIQKGHDIHGMIAELSYKIKRAVERRRMKDDLEKSRQQMTDIINFLPDATFVRDIQGKVIAWNHAMERLTGVSREHIIGKGDLEYSLPFYKEKRPLLADLVLDEEVSSDSRFRYFEKSGDKITSEVYIPHFNDGSGANLWISASPLYDSDGTVTGAIETFRDITDHYTIQRDLNISREMNQGFADIFPVAIFEVDLEFNVTFANRVAYDWFGFSEDVREKKNSLLKFVMLVDRERIINDLDLALKGKTGRGEEYLLIHQDGSTFPGLVYAGKIVDPDTGDPAGVRGIIIDQTEKKKEAQDHYINRERLDLALKAGDIGIWDVDMRTMCVYDVYEWANRTLDLNLAVNSLTVTQCKSMVNPLDLPHLLFAFYQHMSGKKALFEAEFRLACGDRSWKWVAVRGKVIQRGSRNEPARITGTILEINSRNNPSIT
jgi:PAS domain S-box-containing protein